MPIQRPIQVKEGPGQWAGTFTAMAGPCEILVDRGDPLPVNGLVHAAAAEVWRIEQKFSRYRTDNVMHAINSSAGRPVKVDEETAHLLDFAGTCYELSEGRFDVTSGVLRRAWTFDGSDRVPEASAVEALLPLVGWPKVRWNPPTVELEPGMEIDFGGFGKEYAVDRVVALLQEQTGEAFLVNFGGDLRVSGDRAGGEPWHIGVEAPGAERLPAAALQLRRGALATSGDSRRFLLKDGVRYSHVLDPRTGWPVTGAPGSVTVLAGDCTQAGLLATLALLHGPDAEAFLKAQEVEHWLS